jgi:peptidyl-prolyl cis-trans isomerase SurA
MSIQEEKMIRYGALSAFIFFSHLASQLAVAEVVERVVAIVNSEAVLESDIKRMPAKIKKKDLIYDYLIPANETAFMKGERKALLEYLINERIMDHGL